jgi:hypothetical protein
MFFRTVDGGLEAGNENQGIMNMRHLVLFSEKHRENFRIRYLLRVFAFILRNWATFLPP